MREHALIYSWVRDAPTGEEKPKEELMKFLKEQQWALDFGT